jgi:hypothetical protein
LSDKFISQSYNPDVEMIKEGSEAEQVEKLKMQLTTIQKELKLLKQVFSGKLQK